MKKNNKGFSLVELIVVIAIMAILAAIAIPTFSHFITKAHESSDAELLHNINYIFDAACLENGVDVKDVTEATWSMDDMLVTSVKVNGVNNADIVTSFATHFDMTDERFYNIEDLYFDRVLHEFVDTADATERTFPFGNTTITISAEDYAILSGDNAFSNRGAEALLNDVGTLENLLDTGIGIDVLNAVTDTEDFTYALGSYLGLTQGADEDYDTYAARVEEALDECDDPEAALYSAQIMYAASNASNATKEQINSLFTGTVTSNIEVKNNGETDYAQTMANAALAYGMYTAYVEQNNIDTTTNEGSFTKVVNSPEFATYYESKQGQADLEAYMAAMNMIGDNADNPEVTNSILNNGIADNDELESLMKDIMGN